MGLGEQFSEVGRFAELYSVLEEVEVGVIGRMEGLGIVAVEQGIMLVEQVVWWVDVGRVACWISWVFSEFLIAISVVLGSCIFFNGARVICGLPPDVIYSPFE